MKTIMLILWVITLLTSQLSSDVPDYEPKSLQKYLEKVTGCPGIHKEELKPKSDTFGGFNGKFFRFHCGDSSLFAYIGRVNSCRASGCSIDMPNEEFEFFDYYAVYNSELRVQHVSVYNYEATHGQEITAKGWLKQFIGYSYGKPLLVGKNVDAISGATISVNGIVEDLKEKTEILQSLNF
ncbi:MAG TPA: FMN-binding protein [Lentimicrobium sp.]|nr:FMN-binding protein [Lentimicrobium sp.]